MKYLHWPQPLLQLLKISIRIYQILYEVPESALKRQPERNQIMCILLYLMINYVKAGFVEIMTN
jgi:hypothetical protein